MEFRILGWPPDGPTLDLSHERFSYAGKFVRSATGKAVARDDGATVAAAAFNEDRGARNALRIRTITVRVDRRGEGIGSRLLRSVATRALDGDAAEPDEDDDGPYDRVRIAVNNPFAYQAAYRAGFAFTGSETGIRELVLETSTERSEEVYRDGLAVFATGDPTDAEQAFLAARREESPPDIVPVPSAPDE